MIMKNHHFFFLSASPWPLLCSISSFNLLFSLLTFFKFNDYWPFLISLVLISLVSFFWWCTYSGEFILEGKSSLSLESGVKFAMILFISSEVFFFFSFFWGYFHFLLSPSMELGLEWPPHSILAFDFLNVPMINTLILLTSGVTVTISHYYLMKEKLSGFLTFLFLTVLLGGIFTFLQVLEYSSSFFSISDGAFGTSFFMLTGFHGIHVMIGSIFLLTCLLRCLSIKQNSLNFVSFELASWYWHFVDVVWIFLYFFLYYING